MKLYSLDYLVAFLAGCQVDNKPLQRSTKRHGPWAKNPRSCWPQKRYSSQRSF